MSGAGEGLPSHRPKGLGVAGTEAQHQVLLHHCGTDHAEQHAALKAVLIKNYSGVLFRTLMLVILSLHKEPGFEENEHQAYLLSL